MEKLKMIAQKRTVIGKRQNTLRKTGVIPGTVYGFQKGPVPIQVEQLTFEKLYSVVGMTTLFDLNIGENESLPVLIREVQRDPISGMAIHVDFFQVSFDRKIKAKVKVRLEGIASAVKEKGGILVPGLETVSMVCLIQDLPSEILIDLKQLDELGKSVRVKDVKFAESVRVLSNPNDTLVSVVLSRGARKAATVGVSVGDAESGDDKTAVAKK